MTILLLFIFVLAIFLGFELITKNPFSAPHAVDVRIECHLRNHHRWRPSGR